MRNKTLVEDASGRIVGRGVIITIVVVFSSLSFTLGYFVGKNHPQQKADSAAQIISEPAATQPLQNAAVSAPQSPPQSSPESEERHLQNKKAPEQEAVPSTAQNKPDVSKVNVGHAETVSATQKETAKKDSEEIGGAGAKPAPKPSENNVTYTVQIGALKNAADARRLKTKYAQKGYKTSITVSHGKHKEKIYKVRAGEFKDKKEAEILALRLKKTEGLSAFVTVKGS